jgi:hypothetical protein
MDSSDRWKTLQQAVDASNELLPSGWQLNVPEPGETFRWVNHDGRWVSAEIGQGDAVGKVIVKDSSGRIEYVESYEGAIELARVWRT